MKAAELHPPDLSDRSQIEIFVGGFLPNTVQNLLATATADLNSRNHSTLQVFLLATIFINVNIELQLEIFGNTSDTNYKIYNLIYQKTFILYSCAFQFKNNVTLKWYTFNV
jgi:hypothetical protein